MSDHLTIRHEAMKTVFTARVLHLDSAAVKSIGREALELIDDIEGKLSRYIEGSDVWQINHMQAGESLFISDLCYDCLRISLEAYQKTAGLFDVTLGRIIEHKKRSREGPPPSIAGQLIVAPDRPLIECVEPGREIDLGGVGKGFALDKLKELLLESGVESGLISSGASTQLAFGSEPWTLNLQGSKATRGVELKNVALSASGTSIQGSHIHSPYEKDHTYAYQRIWVMDESAAWADIWSTTAMLMRPEELETLAGQCAGVFVDNGKTGAIEEPVARHL